MREAMMNASECSALVENVVWNDPTRVTTLVVLLLINVMVIVGNCLVIAAVFMSSKLRTVTNLFIVSLAVADLMVGLAVLPFSATWEVFKVWIFGDIWCSIWLAVDVWMCTASILNLCAISLDRYVAVTRPVTYPSIMSSGRAKLLIAGVWVLSFVICFPPLVGWKDAKDTDSFESATGESGSNRIRQWTYNDTSSTVDVVAFTEESCQWICELTNDAGYVVYSALGSFYIPMLVMLFFYWRIYRAAVQTTKAINQGFRTTKGSRLLGNRFDEQRLTLRIHRGRGSVMQGKGQHSNGSNSTVTTASNSPSTLSIPGRSPEVPRLNRSSTGRHIERSKANSERIKISVSYPSSDAICSSANNNGISDSAQSSKKNSISSESNVQLYSVHYSNNTTASAVYKSRDNHLRAPGQRAAHRKNSNDNGSDLSPSPTFDDGASGNKPKLISKMGKRNIKAQVKRFRMETKAAKTLGIIVGGFIVCWLPFFTMYLIRAFCVSCIHPVVFSVLFWLGYCNSAINPCIYALFSKDFRFAFKRIICRCFCGKKGESLRNTSRRRGSDGSQLGRHQSSHHHFPNTSQGDDSDPNNDGSDSR